MNLHSHPPRGDCTSPTWTEGPRTQHRKAPEDTRPAPTAQEAQLVPTALATGSLARALAPPSGPHARTPRGCPQLHRSYSALLLVRSISHLRLRCGAVVWPWESSCGARLSCDEGQSLQAVGRAAQTRGSRGSTMAVAVRAAGYLPALCGAPSGHLWSRQLYLHASTAASTLVLKTVLSNGPLSSPGTTDTRHFSSLTCVQQTQSWDALLSNSVDQWYRPYSFFTKCTYTGHQLLVS